MGTRESVNLEKEVIIITNYRGILRLNSLGLNKTQIAEACMCSRTTVIQVLRQAEATDIQYPLPDGMSDKELTEKLYPSSSEKPFFKMPDYKYVHKELQKSGVTLKLLWLEYCEQCRNTGELAYEYSALDERPDRLKLNTLVAVG